MADSPLTTEVSWGFRALDGAAGPMVPTRVYVLGARPSNGKTTFLLTWINRHIETVQALHRGKDTAAFMAYPRRLLAFLTECSPLAARRQWASKRLGLHADYVLRERWDLLPVGSKTRVDAEIKWIKAIEESGWIKFVESGQPTIQVVSEEIETFEPHIVLFDYLQKVRAMRGQSKFDAVGLLIQGLQELATQASAIAMIASQLKRRGDGAFDKYRPPHLEDYKLSGEIEEVADVALGFFRPLRRMTGKEERAVRNGEVGLDGFVIPGAMALKIVKHRHWGEAADKIVRLRCHAGKITDWVEHGSRTVDPPPAGAGDAYEDPEEPALPF